MYKDWEQRKLNTIVERVTRKNKNNESTLPLTISAQDGLVDQNTYFNKQVASKDMSNYYLLMKGDFAYNKSYSNGFPLGTVKRLDKYDQGALSSLYIVFRPKKVNTDFLSIYYDTNKWHREVMKLSAEGARNHGLLNIPVNSFFEKNIIIPIHEKEQLEIAKFLKRLEKIIALHQRKIQILEKIKRCFLQEMLASKEQHYPTLRFSTFEDSWKNYKLKDIILNEFKGKATASMTGTESIYLDTNYLNGGKVSYVDSTSNIDKDDVIILWDGSQAGTVYHGFKGALGSTLKAFKPMYSGSFLYLQLLKNQNRIYHSYRTPNIPHVIKSFSEEFLIPMGSQNEQNKISSFFKIIEYEIKLKKEKLDTLMKIKEVYLQKMFI